METNDNKEVYNPDKYKESDIIGSTNNNLRILYITFMIIIGILLLWIIIIYFTKDDPIKILGQMNNNIFQTPAINDNQIYSTQNTNAGHIIDNTQDIILETQTEDYNYVPI